MTLIPLSLSVGQSPFYLIESMVPFYIAIMIKALVALISSLDMLMSSMDKIMNSVWIRLDMLMSFMDSVK